MRDDTTDDGTGADPSSGGASTDGSGPPPYPGWLWDQVSHTWKAPVYVPPASQSGQPAKNADGTPYVPGAALQPWQTPAQLAEAQKLAADDEARKQYEADQYAINKAAVDTAAKTTTTPSTDRGPGSPGTTSTGTIGQPNNLAFPQPSSAPPVYTPTSGVPSYIPETPVFKPPVYTPPPEFEYDDYVPSDPFAYDSYAPTTAADLTADPSYTFRVGEGLQALTNSAAARGVANTGATLKDFINYGQSAASQEFGAVDARRLTNYTTNRANAFGTWSANDSTRARDYATNRAGAVADYNTNERTQYTDPYKFAYTAAVDAFTPQMTAYTTQAQAGQHEADQERAYGFQTWQAEYDHWRNQQNDDFDRQYKITSL